ncbi:hypothetical protein PsorP6_012341 [Peronosclerospora sorghi]|uniref:Uncharacterized protein n=1 Tax=Peronosclerospora sorghi TaxID=230839 RepID=A0ACC0WIJ3_9STRA|nr:hypothetical protein PsorP6_012341 [Peronosclerospora sorghi]
MLFLDRVLSSALNVSRLLLERDNVTMVLDLLREMKPLVGLQGPNDSKKEYIVAPAADVQAELEASEDENEHVDYEDRDDENDRSEYDDDDEEYDDERDLAKRTIDALEESVIYAGAAAAAPCNTTALSQILMSGNVSTCQADSGYNITSLTMPTNSQVNRVCSSSACMDSIDAVKQVAPDECTIRPVQLYANVINPVLQRCGVSTGSTAGSGSVSGAGSGSGPAAGDVGYGSHAGNAGSVASGSISGSRPMMKPPGTNTSQTNAPPQALLGRHRLLRIEVEVQMPPRSRCVLPSQCLQWQSLLYFEM